MTLGGAAQAAALRCESPNEQTLDPAVCSYNPPKYTLTSRTGLHPAYNVLRQRLNIFSSEYYQILIATHLWPPRPEVSYMSEKYDRYIVEIPTVNLEFSTTECLNTVSRCSHG